MIRPPPSCRKRVLLSFFLLCAAAAALTAPLQAGAAGFKWREAGGRIVYSDLPPPPGARVTLLAAPAGVATGASSTAPVASSPNPRSPSWIEREKASRQQAGERAEAAREEAERQQQAVERERFCEEARIGLRTLESGTPMIVVDGRGERSHVDDSERLRRIEETRRALTEHCNKAS